MPLKVHQKNDASAPPAASLYAGSFQPSARGLVDFLVEKNLLKPGFRQVLHGKPISEISDYLLAHQLFEAEALRKLLAEYFGLPYLRLTDQLIDPKIVQLLPREVVERYKVLPFELKNATLSLAVTEPALLQRDAPNSLIKLRREKGLRIRLVVAPAGDVQAILDKVYAPSPAGVSPAQPADLSTPQPLSSSGPDVNKKVEQSGKTIDLTALKIPLPVLNRIPYTVAKKYQLIVFDTAIKQGTFEPPMIKVAMVDKGDIHVQEILSYIEQRNKILIDRYQTSLASFEAALAGYAEAQPTAPSTIKAPAPAAGEFNGLPGLAGPSSSSPQPIVSPNAPTEPKPTTEITTPAVDKIVTLTAADIVNRPTEESVKDLARLAELQQASLEDQDLDKLIKKPTTSATELGEVFKTGQIPEAVAAMLFLGIRMRASDVHIETEKDYVRIRYRVDGILHDILKVPQFLHAPLIARIKILSKMKIDESRVPQDGRFDVIVDQRQIDLRVSTLPTIHGEKVVMRLLDKSEAMQTLEQLGLTGSNFDVLIKNISKPYGIILSTGPTGSGKSTTLYSILSRISRPGVNIITLEDPVEYELPGVNQAQVMPGIGFTFAEGLRSVLRQDPNVIMVGEIRDLETAAMATQAALTGHLVLSTLHTNEAAGALPRLIDMGVEPFLITSSLNAVVGQRLVRRICENCREKTVIPAAILSRVQKELSASPSGQLKDINLDQLVFYHGRGCPNCTDGYRGRVGIFEVMAMTEEIESLAVKRAPASEIQRASVKAGMVTMVQDGLMKALKGLTTVDEVMRVTMTSIKEVPGTTE